MDAADLTKHMRRTIGGFADVFGWSEQHEVFEVAVNHTLYLVKASQLEQVDEDLLRKAGEVAIWKMVVTNSAVFYDMYTADNERRSRAQMHENALRMYREAVLELEKTTGYYGVRKSSRTRRDPYSAHTANPPIGWWQKR